MKAFLECTTCIIRQTMEILQRLVDNEKKRETILRQVLLALSKLEITSLSPPELTRQAHIVLQKMIGQPDLYKELKKQSNQEVLELYPSLKSQIKKSKDPLMTAIRLAIAGNVIDFGALHRFDLDSTIKKVLAAKLPKNDYDKLKQILGQGRKKILYVGDNAGEIVFDRVLIEELNKSAEVTFAVKSKPSLNDVMMEDAQQVGLDKVCRVIESGSTTPGTVWGETTPEFRRIYREADIVIVKGQGGYETIENEKGKTFYLLIVKCPHLAISMKRKLGDLILCN